MKKDYLALFPAEALSCVYFFADFKDLKLFKRFQNKESFPKIFRFVFEIKLLFFFFFLVQYSGFLTWWFSRDQAEEIEADWELRKDKFYSESAASGYTNEALNLSIDDFGKKPMCSKFW